MGHTRFQCKDPIQKCRFCLADFNEKHNEICSKVYKCAQCKECHFSLDADCGVIKQYRAKLNRAVKQASKDGMINLNFNNSYKSGPNLPPNLNNRAMFPLLPTSSSNTIQSFPWKNINPVDNVVQSQSTDISNQQLFDKICSHFEGRYKQVDSQIRTIEEEVKENAKNIMTMRQNLADTIEMFKSLITDIISPLSILSSKLTTKTDSKTKETIEKIVTIINGKIELIQNNLRVNEKQVYNNEDLVAAQLQVETSNSLIS